MQIEKAFEHIASRVGTCLAKQNFERQDISSNNENELLALFLSEDLAYNIIYYKGKMRMVLRLCSVVDGQPDNKWKSVATWLFDPDADSEKEAESIALDFIETIEGPKQTAIAQSQKKKKKENESNVDSLFFANRMVNYFPELKDEILYEKTHYETFRGITFAQEKILPKFKEFVAQQEGKEMSKFSQFLNDLYENGDLDVKGIISYILINSIEDKAQREKLFENFSDQNIKILDAAYTLKGKKIKPEKPKKKRVGMYTKALENQQR